jgi:general L-amino acid transport system substrate-binding protein
MGGLRRRRLPRHRRGRAERSERGRLRATTPETRFTALTSGEIDVLVRNSTWTFTRDAELALDFTGVNYYDGQGFMVSKDLGVTSATELDGATICIQTGTTTELNLADWFNVNGMTYQPVPIQTNAEADQQFLAGACDSFTTDVSGLAASRAPTPTRTTTSSCRDHLQGAARPRRAPGGRPWADIVRWTLFALIAAEEYGVTSQNIEEMMTSENPRSVACSGSRATRLAARARRGVGQARDHGAGNYGEIFASTIGEGTPSNIARGLNAQWTDGGLQFSPPFR